MDSKKTRVIQTISFIGKLSDVYLFLDYTLNAMDEPIVKEKALSKWVDIALNLIRNERFINKAALAERGFEAILLKAEQKAKESYVRKFSDARKTVLNLSLVMMCTVMELFFEHVFAVIFKANSQTLLILSRDKNITLEQLLRHATYDDVLAAFIQKSIDRIMREGTREVLKAFDCIGVKTNKVFSWNDFTEEVKLQFADWKDEKFLEIFDERHSIVHESAMPLQSFEELLVRQDFFTKIVLNISIQAWHKFHKYGVILEYHEQVRRQIEAEGGDPTGYPPPPG